MEVLGSCQLVDLADLQKIYAGQLIEEETIPEGPENDQNPMAPADVAKEDLITYPHSIYHQGKPISIAQIGKENETGGQTASGSNKVEDLASSAGLDQVGTHLETNQT